MGFKILMLGDIVGRPGRTVIHDNLHKIIEQYSIDMVIANGENASGGSGITESNLQDLLKSGIDVVTSGNHIWSRPELFDFIDGYPNLLRPANYPDSLPGKGAFLFSHPTRNVKIGVLNLLGRVFMPPIDSPFTKALSEIEKLRNLGANIVVLDFHAEATAEKEALGLYLSDKIELFAGTHTHVQTSDEKIINGKMGYITDLGRCGAFFSVLGFDEEESIYGFLTNIPQHFKPSRNNPVIEGVIAEFDLNLSSCVALKRVRF